MINSSSFFLRQCESSYWSDCLVVLLLLATHFWKSGHACLIRGCFSFQQCFRAGVFSSLSPPPSSETQGQIVGTRESQTGEKIYMERRKVKNCEKSPLGQHLTRPFPNGRHHSGFWLVFWHQSEARTAATIWNWSGKTLSPGALLAVLYFSSFHIYFSTRLEFPSPPLSAPGSPRMCHPLPAPFDSPHLLLS